jgi:REP element-mobilizing transposase RayT
MPRPRRTDYEGAWHHVMNRGAGRRPIFENDIERSRFLGCLINGSESYSIEIHGYCLLGNHYHLLVRSRRAQLSDAMRWLSSRYTQSLNYDKGSDGPLFRGRFASVLIESDAHLMQALRYIHLNPVVAGLVSSPEQWPWSSASAYAGSAPMPAWLTRDHLLAMFPNTTRVADYQRFMNEGLDRKAIAAYEKVMSEHGVRPAGSDPGGGTARS